jgi:hypothetical protein
MSKRHGGDEAPFSLDSFLDIVTNVVGVLVLVAMVTVLSAGNISVPSGATAMTATRPAASRLLFECSGDQVFFVDEDATGQQVLEEAKRAKDKDHRITREELITLLEDNDIGDATHRVRADRVAGGVAWVYALRPDAHGERAADLDRPDSAIRKRLAGIEHGGFAYFVVHDDGFEIFRKVRDLARDKGVSVGWHPVEAREPLRLSAVGSLGKRIQ